MRNKHKAVKVTPRKHYLGVMVEIDYGATKRWVEVKVPWRMLNERYQEVTEHLADEAWREMIRRTENQQDPIPGIG